MREFRYERASDTATAVRLAGAHNVKYLGGGTNLVDLMREGIEGPDVLVDVTGLSREIEDLPGGGLLIGAATRNTAVAADRGVRERFPVLARAIVSGASGQLRNMATVGGNLLQRTRCPYFYDGAARCNKREPGAGCDAIGGFTRTHAILGASEHCVATHPSDMSVALAALDALVHLDGPDGPRTVPLVELHRLPGATPDVETRLRPAELITAVEVPGLPAAVHSSYRKVRDRASYAFALVSAAAVLQVEDGTVREARLALGGVAHKPWRARAAEEVLTGAPATSETFRRAAGAELRDARPLAGNAFKIELASRTIAHTLEQLATAQEDRS
jgi:xanthine dehydrogenase YagS FAD-binding subunit